MIDEVLISRDVISEDFQCNLSKCKGACCWEGDYGAPLAKHEIHHLEQCIDEIKSELPIAHQDVIDKQGWHRKYKNDTFDGTQLMDDGRCVFMQHSEVGIAYCTIEKLEGAGKIQTKKPISCHLYLSEWPKMKIGDLPHSTMIDGISAQRHAPSVVRTKSLCISSLRMLSSGCLVSHSTTSLMK